MGRPKEHDDKTRAALLQAAEQLLAVDGAEALSVRRVSEAAGTTTRAVYSLFGSKEGLRSGLYQAAFRGLRQRLVALPETGDPAADLVRCGIEGFRAHALAHPELFRLAFEWPGRRTRTTEADRREALAAFELLVRHTARAGGERLDTAAAQRLAAGFHALCQGLASGEIAGLTGARYSNMLEVWQETLTAYVRGFSQAGTGAQQPLGKGKKRQRRMPQRKKRRRVSSGMR